MTPEAIKKYKLTAVAVDTVIMAIEGDRLQVLLIKTKEGSSPGSWAVPGGLVDPAESIDEAAKRHLGRKTGLRNIYLEQLYAFGEVDRDPKGRVVSVAYFALVPQIRFKFKTTERYSAVQWFPVAALPEMAYDHKEIVGKAVDRLRLKIGYTNIIYGLMPEEFTLTELQKAYEIILGKDLDKRNFRKKILSLGMIEEAGKEKRGEANRPARLYGFVEKKVRIVNIF